MAIGNEEIEKRFGFHKASIEAVGPTDEVHGILRNEFKDFARFLDLYLPEGRYKALAFTELENASMWAHKAIANDRD